MATDRYLYDRIKRAAQAHVNMVTLDHIVRVLEGGDVHGMTMQRTAAKIIDECRKEQKRQSRVWDELSGWNEVFGGDRHAQ